MKDIPTFDMGIDEPEWYEFAACKSYPYEWWFPYSEGSGYLYPQAAKALAVCNDEVNPCPVRNLCLEHALHFATYGIWGGKTANQIKLIRKEQRRAAAR